MVYIGVSSAAGPGRSLREAKLVAAELDYLTPEDWSMARRTSTRALKWARIERFATQAYSQGAALSLHDIAYLVSASVDAVRAAAPKRRSASGSPPCPYPRGAPACAATTRAWPPPRR